MKSCLVAGFLQTTLSLARGEGLSGFNPEGDGMYSFGLFKDSFARLANLLCKSNVANQVAHR